MTETDDVLGDGETLDTADGDTGDKLAYGGGSASHAPFGRGPGPIAAIHPKPATKAYRKLLSDHE